MLSTFIIALREGLEAALIVGILVAYVVKTGRSQLLKPIWSGVAVALLLSFALGAFLSYSSTQLSARGEEIFAGTSSVIAVALVTWMVFWMKRAARGLRDELHGKIDQAHLGGPLTLAVTAFFAVAREGLETALFVYSNFRTVGAASSATVGLVLGLTLAVVLGYLIYRRAVKINLSSFFKVTGVALIVIAAGVLSYGVHEFQEVGWLPGAEALIWDVTGWMPKDSLVASLLGGTVGFDTTTSWLQGLFYSAYLIAVLIPYLSNKGSNKESKKRMPASA